MGFLSLLYKLFLIILSILGFITIYVLYWFISQFPWKHSIPRDDPLFTSAAYKSQFPNTKKDDYIESFTYSGYKPIIEIREDLQKLMVTNPTKFCELLFELYWNERCGSERENKPNSKSPAPSVPPPTTVGIQGGTARIRATVVSVLPQEIAFRIAMRPNGKDITKDFGFEAASIELFETDVKMTIKYLWHLQTGSKWGLGIAVYLQLLGRIACVGLAFQGLMREGVPIEEVDFNLKKK